MKNATRGLIAISMAAFMVPFMGSSINLALPRISEDFSMKAVALTWMATAYLIATAIFQIPFARLADLVGRKKIFLTGIGVFVVGSLLCGFAPSGGVLIALRAVVGIGSAMMFGTSIAILTSLFPPQKRGKVLGINAAVVYAALATGPFLGGMLTHYMGWQSIFFVSAGIGVLVFVMSKLFIKGEWVEARGEPFDLTGSVLFGIGVAGVIYGFSNLPEKAGIISLAAGIIAFVIFTRYELRHKHPVLNLHLFSGNRIFAFSSLAALINYAATAGIGFMMSLYLQYIRGLDARHAGFILVTQAVVQSYFSLISGSLSNRIAPSTLATVGMALSAVALGGLVFLTPETPFWMIIGLLVVLGIAFGIFSAPNTNVIMASVDQKNYTQASAITGTMRLTGQAFSLGIAGMAISLIVGNCPVTPAVYPAFMESLQMTFIVFVSLCLLGIYASSVRGRTIRNT